MAMKKVSPGARWEIIVDGTPRSYRDDRDIAIGSTEYLKEKNPRCEVAVWDLKGKEDTVVIKWRPK